MATTTETQLLVLAWRSTGSTARGSPRTITASRLTRRQPRRSASHTMGSEKKALQAIRRLGGKVVADPTNPIGFNANGEPLRTLPEGQSSGQLVAALLPAGAHYVTHL